MFRLCVSAVAIAGGVLASDEGMAQVVNDACRNGVTVERGDTLSRIAARCDVSEGSILAANPGVNGSNDLQVGETLRIESADASGEGFERKLNSFASDANDALGRVAGRVGASVQDLLDKNPDLKSRLDRLGSKIGLGDGTTKAALTVTPASGTAGSTVTLAGTGLPGNSPVSIGAAAPGSAYEVIQTGRTSSTGTLDAHVQVPTWASAGGSLRFIVKTGSGDRVQSVPFQVGGG